MMRRFIDLISKNHHEKFDRSQWGPLLILLSPPQYEKDSFLEGLNDPITTIKASSVSSAFCSVTIADACAVWEGNASASLTKKLKSITIGAGTVSVYDHLRCFKCQEQRYLTLFFQHKISVDVLKDGLAQVIHDMECYNTLMEALYHILVSSAKDPPTMKSTDVLLPIQKMFPKAIEEALQLAKNALKNFHQVIAWDDGNLQVHHQYKEVMQLASKYGRTVRFVRWGQELPSLSLQELFIQNIRRFLETGRWIESKQLRAMYRESNKHLLQTRNSLLPTHYDLAKQAGFDMDVIGRIYKKTTSKKSHVSFDRKDTMMMTSVSIYSAWNNTGLIHPIENQSLKTSSHKQRRRRRQRHSDASDAETNQVFVLKSIEDIDDYLQNQRNMKVSSLSTDVDDNNGRGFIYSSYSSNNNNSSRSKSNEEEHIISLHSTSTHIEKYSRTYEYGIDLKKKHRIPSKQQLLLQVSKDIHSSKSISRSQSDDLKKQPKEHNIELNPRIVTKKVSWGSTATSESRPERESDNELNYHRSSSSDATTSLTQSVVKIDDYEEKRMKSSSPLKKLMNWNSRSKQYSSDEVESLPFPSWQETRDIIQDNGNKEEMSNFDDMALLPSVEDEDEIEEMIFSSSSMSSRQQLFIDRGVSVSSVGENSFSLSPCSAAAAADPSRNLPELRNGLTPFSSPPPRPVPGSIDSIQHRAISDGNTPVLMRRKGVEEQSEHIVVEEYSCTGKEKKRPQSDDLSLGRYSLDSYIQSNGHSRRQDSPIPLSSFKMVSNLPKGERLSFRSETTEKKQVEMALLLLNTPSTTSSSSVAATATRSSSKAQDQSPLSDKSIPTTSPVIMKDNDIIDSKKGYKGRGDYELKRDLRGVPEHEKIEQVEEHRMSISSTTSTALRSLHEHQINSSEKKASPLRRAFDNVRNIFNGNHAKPMNTVLQYAPKIHELEDDFDSESRRRLSFRVGSPSTADDTVDEKEDLERKTSDYKLELIDIYEM